MKASKNWRRTTIKADKQLTAAAGFADPRSFVAPDGREVLYAADWEKRKRELWDRSRGRCEQWIAKYPDVRKCLTATWRCAGDAEEPDHIIKRSKGRDDRLSNLQALCHRCHSAKHKELQPRWSCGEAMRQAKGGS